MKTANTKQFGDACEMLVCAELTLAGIPALIVPDIWPSYDLIAETSAGPARISVKGLRAGNGQDARFWRFKPDDWDYLALVRVNIENGVREIFILSREKALELAVDERNGKYHLNYSNPGLQAYRNNFTLKLGV